MLAFHSQLMPEQPAKGPPSLAPLSAADADRLAESFTPFWEGGDAPAPTATAKAPAVPPTPVSAATTTKTPAPSAANRAVVTRTILGIAPLTLGQPAPTAATPASLTASRATSQAEVASRAAPAIVPEAAPTIVPEAAPNAGATSSTLVSSASSASSDAADAAPSRTEVVVTGATTQPLSVTARSVPTFDSKIDPPSALGVTAPLALDGSAVPANVDSNATSAAARQSMADVPGYAIAYTPKDSPDIPAVVIAPEAQSRPGDFEARAVSSSARVVPLPRPPEPVTVQSDISTAPDLVPYAPRKSGGKLIAVGVGGAALLLAAFVGYPALSHRPPPATSRSSAEPIPARAADIRQPTQPAPTQVEVPTEAPAPTQVSALAPELTAPALASAAEGAAPPSSPDSASALANPPAPPTARVNRPPPGKGAATPKASRARTKTESVAATPTRPVTRPPGVSSTANSPAAKSATGKGVIVRDTPF